MPESGGSAFQPAALSQQQVVFLLTHSSAKDERAAAVRAPLHARLAEVGDLDDAEDVLDTLDSGCPADRLHALNAVARILERVAPEDPRLPVLALRAEWNRVLSREAPTLPGGRLCDLQAAAADIVQATFTNAFNTDGALKHEIGLFRTQLGPAGLSRERFDAVFGSDLAAHQVDAVRFLLASLPADDRAGGRLRMELFRKLGGMGDANDLERTLALLRTEQSGVRQPASEAANLLLERGVGLAPRSPRTLARRLRRTRACEGAVRLPDADRIETILTEGRVLDLTPFKNNNMNDTYVVSFGESVRGPGGATQPVRAMWKPEEPGQKLHPFFTREVAAYQFDRLFTQRELIPPTVETTLSKAKDKSVRIGSLQYWLEGARTLGETCDQRDPALDYLFERPDFVRQFGTAKTMVFIMNDEDKLGTDIRQEPNYNNIVIDPMEQVWLIDNAGAFGGLEGYPGFGGAVPSSILPEAPEPAFVARLLAIDPDKVVEALRPLVGVEAAKATGMRLRTAAEELRPRLRRQAQYERDAPPTLKLSNDDLPGSFADLAREV